MYQFIYLDLYCIVFIFGVLINLYIFAWLIYLWLSFILSFCFTGPAPSGASASVAGD